jgi:hypothetical protein
VKLDISGCNHANELGLELAVVCAGRLLAIARLEACEILIVV